MMAGIGESLPVFTGCQNRKKAFSYCNDAKAVKKLQKNFAPFAALQ